MKNIFLIISISLVFFTSIDANSLNKSQRLVWPPAPDDARIEYISSIRSSEHFGIEKGFFTKVYDFIFGEEDPLITAPFGIHADNKRVYVTDISSQSLNIFDKKENDFITLLGSEDELFLYPIDVVSDKNGNIYVSDSVRAKIFVFDIDGDFTHSIKPKSLQRPVGIAISADSNKLYIVDSLSDQIHVTTLDGKYINSIGKRGSGNGEFNRPTFLDVGNDGKIYLSDSMNHRIQILDANGNYLSSFGSLGSNIGNFANPRGVALDSDENIYVTDTVYNSVQIFNKNGEVLMKFGSYGKGEGNFALVEDITILPDNTIYIADTNNRCFKVFKRLDPTNKRSSK